MSLEKGMIYRVENDFRGWDFIVLCTSVPNIHNHNRYTVRVLIHFKNVPQDTSVNWAVNCQYEKDAKPYFVRISSHKLGRFYV